MKKLYSFIAIAIFGLTAMTFTSCDEDQLTGITLEGTWEGDMYTFSEWSGNTYWASSTELEFVQDPFRFTSGTGYWVDYYSDAPWDYIASHIDWTVRNGVISIYFREDHYTLDIYDYRLSNNNFSGYIYDGGKKLSFCLHHTYSPNWGGYNYGYDYWYDNWYYAKKAPMVEDDTDTTAIKQTTPEATRPTRGVGKK